jgi:hypothetical protein
MADSIKASFDVPFKNPFWTVLMAEQTMSLCQGISTATFPPKAIGMAVSMRFRDGIEAQQVECLHGPIDHRRNARSTLPPHPNHLWDSSPLPIRITRSADRRSRSSCSDEGSTPISSSDSLTGTMPPSP